MDMSMAGYDQQMGAQMGQQQQQPDYYGGYAQDPYAAQAQQMAAAQQMQPQYAQDGYGAPQAGYPQQAAQPDYYMQQQQQQQQPEMGAGYGAPISPTGPVQHPSGLLEVPFSPSQPPDQRQPGRANHKLSIEEPGQASSGGQGRRYSEWTPDAKTAE